MLLGICNPQQPGCCQHIDGIGDYKSPGIIGRTFFTTDCKSVGTPNGVQSGTEEIHFRSAGYPISSVRRPGGFAIRRQKNDLTSLCSGDLQSPATRLLPAYRWDRGLQIPQLNRSNLFYDG